MEPIRRLDSLTGLRWWAAFGVFLFHLPNLITLPGQVFLRLGDFGVAFFFILSGFVLTYAARAGTAVSLFYWRRFARIWPAHIVSLAIAIPVFYAWTPDPEQWWVKPFSWGILFLSVVVLQGWSRDPVILFSGNPAAWTLTVEGFFYALHPFFHRIVRVLNGRRALVAIVIVLAITFAIPTVSFLWSPPVLARIPFPLLRLTEFVLGMLIARAIQLGCRVRLPNILIFAGSSAVFLAIGLLSFAEDLPTSLRLVSALVPSFITVLFILVIAVVVTNELAGKRSLLSTRFFTALGDMSFAFYLVHATVIYATRASLGFQGNANWSNVWIVPAVFFASLMLAAALHYGVERPAERWLRARGNVWLRKPRTSDPVA